MFLGLIASIILGLMFGSFGSVILSRWGNSTSLKQASSIIWGRSECPHCKTTLQAKDLVPLVSFFVQKGRCRYCRKKISLLYPVLEIGSALIFGLCWYLFYNQGLYVTAYRMLTTWMLWLIIVYDVLRYELHIPLLIGLVILIFVAMEKGLVPWDSLWGGLIFLVMFLVLYFIASYRVRVKYRIKEEGLGMGDVFMSPYLGILLFSGLSGYDSLDKILAILYFFVISGLIGIVWFFIQNKWRGKKANFLNQRMADQSLPFIPSMIIAVFIIMVFKDVLFGSFMF